MQVATEADTEPLKASSMLEIPEPALGPDEVGDPPFLPPQVKVHAATGTHTEPLGASPMTKMLGPANASITIVKHKQSLALAHVAADQPSPPN